MSSSVATAPFLDAAQITTMKKAALVLRAINHKLRQQMLILIKNKGSITVTEIYVKLRMEQSVASQHLAILRKAELVSTRRDGKCIYYSVNDERLHFIHRQCRALVNNKAE